MTHRHSKRCWAGVVKTIHRPSLVSKAPPGQPILEVNAQHALVKRLESDEKHFDDLAHLLFDQAWLAEGGQLEDPASHVQRVTRLLTSS